MVCSRTIQFNGLVILECNELHEIEIEISGAFNATDVPSRESLATALTSATPFIRERLSGESHVLWIINSNLCHSLVTLSEQMVRSVAVTIAQPAVSLLSPVAMGVLFAEEPITIRKLIPQALELVETTLTPIPSFSAASTPKYFSRCATSHSHLHFARSLFHLQNRHTRVRRMVNILELHADRYTQSLVTHRDELQTFMALIPGEERIVEMILERSSRQQSVRSAQHLRCFVDLCSTLMSQAFAQSFRVCVAGKHQ
jgi:hypothetical protein